MKYNNKTLEEQAEELVSEMTKEDLEVAIQEQDSELMKHILKTLGETVDIVGAQGRVIEKLTDRAVEQEKNMSAMAQLSTQIVAKIEVIMEQLKK